MALSRIDIAKRKSIISYLQRKGIFPVRQGRNYFIRSPFSEEKRASFVIYDKTETFYDYSTGKHGDIIDLVMHLEKLPMKKAIDFLLSDHEIKEYSYADKKEIVVKKFNIWDYFQKDWRERSKIKAYASYRGIPYENYLPGNLAIWNVDKEEVEYKNALMFPHQDQDGKITGMKARLIYDNDIRFTARGKLGFYVLRTETNIGVERLYIVESETSANSLQQFLKSIQVNATILCFGGVHQSSKIELPDKFCNLFPRLLVIDYDGDEKLYQERIQNFEHLNCKNVKIKVGYGDDLNSLYMKGMIGDYIHEILDSRKAY